MVLKKLIEFYSFITANVLAYIALLEQVHQTHIVIRNSGTCSAYSLCNAQSELSNSVFNGPDLLEVLSC